MGTEVVDAGLNGADTINRLLDNDGFVLQLALILVGIGFLKLLFSHISDTRHVDDEVAKIDSELISSLAEHGFDMDGNRLDCLEEQSPDQVSVEEDPLYERRERTGSPYIHSARVSSRHYTGEYRYDRRNTTNISDALINGNK